jgi:hypothetical protein
VPTVRFTDNIQRHVECPTRVVAGARVRDALEDGGDSWQTVSSDPKVAPYVRTVSSRYAAPAPNSRLGAHAASIGATTPPVPRAAKTLKATQ